MKKMAITSKKLSLYLVAGVASAVIIIAALFASGVKLPSNDGSQNPTALGTLEVSIKDAPVDLSRLDVKLDAIQVQGGDNGGWTKLNFIEETNEVSFNLLALQDIAKDLSIAQLPVGNYTKIRLHILEATATFKSDSPTATPTPIPLKVPSDKIDIIIKFEIKEGATTRLLIDMTADWVAISNSHNLKPVLKATVTPPTAPSPTPTPVTSPTIAPAETLTTTPAIAGQV